MSRKNRKRDKEHRRRETPSKPLGTLSAIPDQRVMERVMQQLSGVTQEKESEVTPLQQAHVILLQAYQEKDAKLKNQLALQALEVCPDCAEAYLLLASLANPDAKILEYLEKGVQAGERAIGAEAFQKHVGHFWTVPETRPYMRAKEIMANALWRMGRREEAIRHMQELIHLNPADDQGIRYSLAAFLLEQNENDRADVLLQQFAQDESTAWVYANALLLYRREGDSLDARELLAKALHSNKYVPDYLLGNRLLPHKPLPRHVPGRRSEAVFVARVYFPSWKYTPGALTWLRQVRKSALPPDKQPKGPLALIKSWLQRRVPRNEETWQADYRQTAEWLHLETGKERPWIMFVMDGSNGRMLTQHLMHDMPSSQHLWDTLVQAMQNPAMGESCRPARLQVRGDELWRSLKPHLEQIGIELVETESLNEIDKAFAGLQEVVLGKPRVGLLEVPGVQPELAASCFEAAADFYRKTPWRAMPGKSTIKVECDKCMDGPWYATVMGQTAVIVGLAIYRDLGALEKVHHGKWTQKEQTEKDTTRCVLFGEKMDLAMKDLEAIEKFGWSVATPEAYPGFYTSEPGPSVRPLVPWELDLVEACLRTIPEFLARHRQDDFTAVEMPTTTGSGPVTLRLSWIPDKDEEISAS